MRRDGATGAGGRPPDGRGQSETVGVVLLVAVGIVLAAGVGQLVFGLHIVQAGEQGVGPQVSFAGTVDGDTLTLEHRSGDTIRTRDLTVVGSRNGAYAVDWNVQGIGDEWTAGESLVVSPVDGETVRLVWASSTTDDSTIVLDYGFRAD